MIKFCSLFSGSSGNSIFISDGNTKILVDSGVSAKKIAQALISIGENASDLTAILVSHEHTDHIKGLGALCRKFDIPVYANKATWDHIDQYIGVTDQKNRMMFFTNTGFDLGAISINPFPIPHDASDPVGFSFISGNEKITVATDIGHVSQELLGNIEKSTLLLIEANHDIDMLRVGRYPWWLKNRISGDAGHLSNDAAAGIVSYMAAKGTKKFILGHLSKENNFPELAWQTVSNALSAVGIIAGDDIILEIALRNTASMVFEL